MRAKGAGRAALLALALAACSPKPQTETPAAASEAPPAPAALNPVGNPPDRSAGRPIGRMVGEVSPLTGDRSGLNVRVTDFGVVVDLPADALFEFDKATLTPAAEVDLRKAAALIAKSPPGPIAVVGHTDAKGDDAYNQRLSEARARAVADWFGQQVGVRQRAFTVSGKGETAPIAPNQTASGADDPAGRAKNRRVEVILPKA